MRQVEVQGRGVFVVQRLRGEAQTLGQSVREAIRQFTLHRREETLHHRVVVAVAPATHAARDAVGRQPVLVVLTRVRGEFNRSLQQLYKETLQWVYRNVGLNARGAAPSGHQGVRRRDAANIGRRSGRRSRAVSPPRCSVTRRADIDCAPRRWRRPLVPDPSVEILGNVPIVHEVFS